MGQTILILGNSGTGKTTSLRNFKSNEITLIKTINKLLPFKGQFEDQTTTDLYTTIISKIQNSKHKVIVVDDFQYVMSNEFFRRAKETTWDKYNDIGSNVYKILHAADNLPDDVFVYILAHTQIDDNGIEKIKTIGKMIDEKLTVEGLCTVVLKTVVTDGVYSFQTQNTGHDTCKSPIGMFDNFLIDNDLKMVDTIMRNYWGYTNVSVEERAVAKDAPSLLQPKVKPTKEAKERKLKEAPVINNEAQSDESLVREAQGFSEPISQPSEEIKKEVLTDEVAEEVVEDTQPIKEMLKEEAKVDKMAALKAKIAMSKIGGKPTVQEVKEEVKEEPEDEDPVNEPQPTVEKSKAELVREKLAFLKARKG